MAPQADLSINYNNGAANNPSDYFIAPSTEGERNNMPGDLDDDFDMDNNDYERFLACLDLPAEPPFCSRGDFNDDRAVNCLDWPSFAAYWQQYSTLPLPTSPCPGSCTPGDFTHDNIIDGLDVQGFVAAIMSTNPPCEADVDGSGRIDCNDAWTFTMNLLAAPADCRRGDVNFDGCVNGADIQPFANLLLVLPPCLSPSEFCAADFDANQAINTDDIEPFILRLITSPDDGK